MPDPIALLSFSTAIDRWSAQSERAPTELAQEVAAAMVAGGLKYRLDTPGYPYIDHHGSFAILEDPREEEFLVDLSDHLERVARGIDTPDFDRLRYVGLDREEVEAWLKSTGLLTPEVDRVGRGEPEQVSAGHRLTAERSSIAAGEPGQDEYQTLQKILAVLAIIAARKTGHLRVDGSPVQSKLHAEIEHLLETEPQLCDQLGHHGLGIKNVSRHIKNALDAFGLDR